MRRELEMLSALRRELGRALQSFSGPLSATMQLFSDAKEEGSEERWQGVAEACDATLRELQRMTNVLQAMRDALVRRNERLSIQHDERRRMSLS
jgi:hypothetical protein